MRVKTKSGGGGGKFWHWKFLEWSKMFPLKIKKFPRLLGQPDKIARFILKTSRATAAAAAAAIYVSIGNVSCRLG